ncbi:transposase [Arthrobacter sp. NPDC093128]|uniref:IS110 family transposase n=1 Tax=Arthrobacter sp. NPDC093128 TaxID=3154979 RepID=UPI003439B109
MVAVDVGKTVVALSVTDAGRHRLLGPVDFEMTRRGLEGILGLIRSRLAGVDVPVKVGIESAGHFHRPLLMPPSAWPAGWQVLGVNPAHVAEQCRVQGRRRVKTTPWIWRRSPAGVERPWHPGHSTRGRDR